MTEDGGLFNKKSRSDVPELPYAKKAETDLYVSPGDSQSRKMLDPYGQNELDKITFSNIWTKASKGDEHVPRYTEYAIADDLRETMLAPINHVPGWEFSAMPASSSSAKASPMGAADLSGGKSTGKNDVAWQRMAKAMKKGKGGVASTPGKTCGRVTIGRSRDGLG